MQVRAHPLLATGTSTCTWSVNPQGERPRVTLRWTEARGPASAGPIMPSLGLDLIVGFIEHDMGGKAALTISTRGGGSHRWNLMWGRGEGD